MQRKAISLALSVLMIVTVFSVVIVVVPEPASGATLIVGPGQTHTTISSAISASSAGDTILVWAGTYNEVITIPHNLNLIGNGSSNTTINGFGTGDVVTVNANFVNITGFKIMNSGNNPGDAGVHLVMTKWCKIENCNLTNNYDGVYLWPWNDNNTIANNTAMFNGRYGIHIDWKSNNNTVRNNTCTANTMDGIALASAFLNTIENNYCNQSVAAGGIVAAGWLNTIQNNTCNLNNKNGIYLWLSSTTTVENNTCNFNNQHGFALQNSWPNNRVANCTSISNAVSGIVLTSSRSNTIYNNTVSNNRDGIAIGSSNNCIIDSNTCNANNLYGISIGGSTTNTLVNNKMFLSGLVIGGNQVQYWNTHTIGTNNTLNGKPVYYWKDRTGGTVPLGAGQVILANCTNVVVRNQNVSYGTVGIALGFSSKNTIRDNVCHGNLEYGIHFKENSNQNTIFGNAMSFTYNSVTFVHAGMRIEWGCNNNLIYKNNFIFNLVQARDTGNNFWNNTQLMGNYWTDYLGLDCGGMTYPWDSTGKHLIAGDGIGDTFLPQYALDFYPLMIQWNYTFSIVYVDDNFNSTTPQWQAYRFDKIQDGIDNVSSPGSVYVFNGTYNESVLVNKSINVVGNGTSVTIINGSGTGHVVNITSGWANVTRFTVKNGGSTLGDAGIAVQSSNYTKIENNNCSNNGYNGIFLKLSTNNTIANNTCSNNGYNGIFLWKSPRNKIKNNTYDSNYYYGIVMSWSSGNTIENNTLNSTNDAGIYVWESPCNTLINNTMVNCGVILWGYQLQHWNTHSIDTSNTVSGKPVYYWKNQTGGVVPSGAGQILMANCTGVTIQNQNVSDGGIGIEIGFSPGNTIINNIANTNDDYGIHLYRSSGNTLDNNTCNSNRYNGFSLIFSPNNNITNNTASYNGHEGIHIFRTYGNTVDNNTCSNNREGIYLYQSHGNTISNNTCSNNAAGIELYWKSNGNTIENNTCLSNGNGILLAHQSNNNLLYNNTCNLNTNHGVYLFYTANSNTLENNTCNSNTFDGIYVRNCTSIYIGNNTLNSNSQYGIYAITQSSMTSIGNTIRFNSVGVKTQTGSTWLSAGGDNVTNNIQANIILGDPPIPIIIRGAYIANSVYGIHIISSNPLIENCIIVNNTYGIYITNSNPVINNNTIIHNTYGIFNDQGSNSIITNNYVSSCIYGIYNYNSNALIAFNNISNNYYGIYNDRSSPDINNNTFMNNYYAVYNLNYSHPTTVNNLFLNNIHDIYNVKWTLDFHPKTLNAKSEGKWVTCYIELPAGYDVSDISISTIRISDINGNPLYIPAESHPTSIDDYDNDGVPDLMVKFDRSDIEDYTVPGIATIHVIGELTYGMKFEGGSIMRIINP